MLYQSSGQLKGCLTENLIRFCLVIEQCFRQGEPAHAKFFREKLEETPEIFLHTKFNKFSSMIHQMLETNMLG